MSFSAPDRRRFAKLAAACAAAALADPAPLHAQEAPELRHVEISVGGRASFYYLPLCIADRLGYFSAEGVEVMVHDFAGGSLARDALLAGAVDVCSGAYEHTIDLQGRRQYYEAFVLQGRAPQIAFGVSTRTMPNYESPAELRGRRIGVSAPGSSTDRIARLTLARAGLKPGDASFVGVGTSSGALEAVRSGRIDAVSNVEPVITMLEQRGDLKIVSDTRTLQGTIELFGGLMPAACLYASADFVQRHPRTVQALADAIVRALKWLQTAGPSDIVKTVPENYLLGDRALYLSVFSKVRQTISPDGVLGDDGPLVALRALAAFDSSIKPGEIDLRRTFTNRFANRAKARFRA